MFKKLGYQVSRFWWMFLLVWIGAVLALRRFGAAHFEWLLRFGQPLGLTFNDMGKRRHGTASTLLFCDELFRLYGSDDYNEAMGAAFAVENWAAAAANSID